MDLIAIKKFAQNVLEDDLTGHDWLHALRVEENAKKISPAHLTENELNIVRAAAWLHDTIDEKIASDKRVDVARIKEILTIHGASPDEISEIIYTIQNLSYSKNIEQNRKLSKLGQIVQDADRLDAIGAIGIARTFYFGGHKGHPLYDQVKPRSLDSLTEENYREETSVLNHFYEKLLLLQDSMNTEAGTREAIKRTDFMKLYLEQFYQEISHS